ncbi:protein SOB FIVE-LIKE 5-like [Salvia splendens]|uniref:protein SOB FIVE-LIKE 5-like n=1 Tax=Salvia splendens TaxID=180675 RepID=UPI001C265599|nr:protein SOB FIVE-LIKE 5-like [Salvia splendens]
MNYMFRNQEWSSGCESGWTLYLQQSSISTDESPTKRSNEDEDLSMVSDASSGPPQLHEEENDKNDCFFNYNYTTTVTKPLSKTRENRCRKKVQDLDDTASSQLYNKARSQTSVENINVVEMEYSEGYSSTQFEVRPAYQEEHYQLQQQNQWFEIEGKRW